MSSRHYLASLLEDITPTDQEKREVQDAVDRVVAATRALLRIAEVRPAGSWAKSTMLRGRKEADVVALLAEAPSDATRRLRRVTSAQFCCGDRRHPRVRSQCKPAERTCVRTHGAARV